MKVFGDELRTWVEQQWPNLDVSDFANHNGVKRLPESMPQWQPLSGDAGFRRYFRLPGELSLLAVYAPPATENMTAFIDVAEHLRASGVCVPVIAAHDKARGFMLIEDLGVSLLAEKLSTETADELYKASIQSLCKIQRSSPDMSVFPFYTKAKLLEEMNLFKEWFVLQLLGEKVSSVDSVMLDEWFLLLAESALEQPQAIVHRDYHSRNLLYRELGLPGVIDFQDAVVGPITYDLVSLLRDCYVHWSDEKVKSWIDTYLDTCKHNELAGVERYQFIRWFDLMGLQRHIKVLGVFARLSLRDGKHGYLNDLPLVIHYTLRVAKQYREADAFVSWFERNLLPVIEHQSWYQTIPEVQA